MPNIKEILNGIIQRVPGVAGVILIDIDGIPIEIAGRFDMNQEDLGALLATCYRSYETVGRDLGQPLRSIIVEYNDLKLCQTSMPRGLLTILAGKDSYLGMIRLEAKRAIEALTQTMANTEEAREILMEAHKFRWPDNQTIDDILSRIKNEYK
jgi:predicted regulator of Ras-like GTPase activity (Roadblock/LC7/MglB family)